MPAYSRKSTIEDEYGARRMPGGSIQCGFCGRDIADPKNNPTGTIYVIYTDKNHLKNNIPYDVYCEECKASNFPKAIGV